MPAADTVIAPPCVERAADRIRSAVESEISRCIDAQLSTVDRLYRQRCAAPASIDDTLVVKYPLHYQHFTLYYYDRAGALVRTVPPKGVKKTTTSRASHPSHTYVTESAFNSFGQPVRHKTPDGGTTLYFYDSLDRIRFTQDAAQQAAGSYSYVKYDRLGRVVEVGESAQDGSGSAFLSHLNDMSYPALGRQRTYTVYTTPSGVQYLDRTLQRNLRNRVSYSYTDDGTRTHYSYDEHGLVEWIAQEAPGLPRANYVRYEYDLISGNVNRMLYNDGRADQFHHRYSYDLDNRLTTVETSFDGVIWDSDARYQYEDHGPVARRELGEDKVTGEDYTFTIEGSLKGINHPSLVATNDPGQDGVSNVYAADSFAMGLSYYRGDFRRSGSSYDTSSTTELHRQRDYVPQYDGNIAGWSVSTGKHVVTNAYNEPVGETYRYDLLGRLDSSRFRGYNDTASGEKWRAVTGEYNTQQDYDANGNLVRLDRNASGSGTAKEMDRLTYIYGSGTNRLTRVKDDVTGAPFTTDVASGQGIGNYSYNARGETC